MICSVAGIEFSYNSHPVLNDVHLHVDRGEILVVLGVNGSGKSTLLKCLNGILKPRRGSVFVRNVDTRQMNRRAIASLMGYVPQRCVGEDGMSVFDAVLLGRKPHIGWSATGKDLLIVEGILDMMHLSAFALRPVTELSGGEMQKVMIARALAQQPEILILDEPTSNLDLKNQMEVMGLLAHAAQAQEVAVIVAMHDLNMALRFADRFLMLKGGRVHAVANKEGLTAEMVAAVYDIQVTVAMIDGNPVIVPAHDHSRGCCHEIYQSPSG